MIAPIIFKGDDLLHRVTLVLNAARREAGLPEEPPCFSVTIAIKGFEVSDEQMALLRGKL